ncbi:FAD-dependent monooxygenase [Galactobacter sp.]|uniref:FAD-dependent monooxygenase n=1 Tax=Galactobacter sp. TaxID=2676125 RepID=UPI0025C11877|nr:FAD-dependent monooxygenase [Galactobacter sp.]
MQYHINGYTFGDPTVQDAGPDARPANSELPGQVDVLIVGTGPAGAVMAAQLARFEGLSTAVVERRQGPLLRGHADGVACRTVEMFQAFGLASALLDEAYWVNETTFWAPNEQHTDEIERIGTINDTADGMSEFPHVIVNQARMQEMLFDSAQRASTRTAVDYGWHFVDVVRDDTAEYPLTVTLAATDEDNRPTSTTRQIRAKYVIGCDGARSAVRAAIGRELQGDVQNHAWGVLDILPVTNFPDIRKKAVIRSESGSIILIPREGGNLVRVYVDLGAVDAEDTGFRERTQVEDVIAAAQRVFSPWTLDVREVAWWSVYEVGQRLADGFDDVDEAERGTKQPRVFIMGDACHTHSAKAGQGMNVSMQDAFNLAWKLGAVLRGQADPALLDTYSQERWVTAKALIDYDIKWAAMVGSRNDEVSAEDVQAQFVDGGRFTAGFATHYKETPLVGTREHQDLASGFVIGERFHSAPAIRVMDAKPVELGHVHEADGRWRVYVFADRNGLADGGAVQAWAAHQDADPASAINRFTAPDAERDSVFDVRLILQDAHRDVDPTTIPSFFRPEHGRFNLPDLEKVFSAEATNGRLLGNIPGIAASQDVYDLRGIDRDQGAVVVVRPDQYIAQVLPLDAPAELAAVVGQFMVDRRSLADTH